MSRLPVRFLVSTVQDDLSALPSKALRTRAFELLARLKTENPLLGKPCAWQASTGDLSDCRKLYFDETPDRDPRYRIVYRLVPNEETPTHVEVIKIGLKLERQGSQAISAYVEAARRLGRL